MHQLALIRTWGGRHAGAGRKPSSGRRSVMHRQRPAHDARCPVHVTMRAGAGLASLRSAGLFSAVRRALTMASDDGFRVLQFSVQMDHVHLLVEAEGTADLRSGIQGLAIRIARAVNRALGRRGRIWSDITRASCEPPARSATRSSTCSRIGASTCRARAGSTRARLHAGSAGGGTSKQPSSPPRRSRPRVRGSRALAGSVMGSSTSPKRRGRVDADERSG